MKLLSWQEEALAAERVLARVCRGGRKTLTAVKWARERGAGKEVLFVTHKEWGIGHVHNLFHSLYKEDIAAGDREGRIAFTDGTVVHIMSAKEANYCRGLRIDVVVIDEIEFLSEDQLLAFMGRAAGRANFPFFATYSSESSGNTRRIKKMDAVAAVTYIYADYLDMLAAGLMKPGDVRAAMDGTNKRTFEAEYGPWKAHSPKPLNSWFKYLLDSERA